MKKIYKIKGLECPSCAKMLELDLEEIGIKGICNYAESTLEIEDIKDNKEEEKIKEVLRKNNLEIED